MDLEQPRHLLLALLKARRGFLHRPTPHTCEIFEDTSSRNRFPDFAGRLQKRELRPGKGSPYRDCAMLHKKTRGSPALRFRVRHLPSCLRPCDSGEKPPRPRATSRVPETALRVLVLAKRPPRVAPSTTTGRIRSTTTDRSVDHHGNTLGVTTRSRPVGATQTSLRLPEAPDGALQQRATRWRQTNDRGEGGVSARGLVISHRDSFIWD
ncbi:hypothetical protein BV898_19688 [Hypsibius exemplaris]|uniref:Uncharacterized protein n=1 Tax=Hypsibius exemplaris TaxID=2072580 RepID=A0A9X6NJF3_HYPEX|nr:hypothetical protein BV898_19688 [Hypsibius exemplaris]